MFVISIFDFAFAILVFVCRFGYLHLIIRHEMEIYGIRFNGLFRRAIISGAYHKLFSFSFYSKYILLRRKIAMQSILFNIHNICCSKRFLR